MLILPPGHARALQVKRPFSTREKSIIGVILGLVAALVLAVVVSLASTGHQTGNGCVDVTIPYSIGGQEFYECGAAARAMCAQVGAPGGFSGGPGRAVAAECRKAGLPVG